MACVCERARCALQVASANVLQVMYTPCQCRNRIHLSSADQDSLSLLGRTFKQHLGGLSGRKSRGFASVYNLR